MSPSLSSELVQIHAIMLLDIISLLLKLGGYFWDIGVDILVGRQQIEKTFPQYRFEGKQYHHIQGNFFQVGGKY